MSERYNEIKKVNKQLWTEKCPVLINKYALLHDSMENKNILQLQFQNISRNVITYVYFVCHAYSVENEIISSTENSILDLSVKCGETFGDRIPYQVDEKARFFQFEIIKIGFEGADSEKTSYYLKELKAQEDYTKLTYFDQFVKEYKNEKSKAKFVPEFEDAFWRCTCGQVNIEDRCVFCGINRDELVHISDSDFLKERKLAYEEEQQRIKKIEEGKKEEKRKLLKKYIAILAIIGVIIGVLVIGVGVYKKAIKPGLVKHKINEALGQNDYETVERVIDELNGRKDSEKELEIAYITYCNALIDEERLAEASEIIKDADIDSKAIEDLRSEIDYSIATQYMQQELWSKAIELFESLEDYKDSKDKLEECNQSYNNKKNIEYSKQKWEEGEKDLAIQILKNDGSNEAKELLEQYRYDLAVEALEHKDYKKGMAYLEDCQGFIDEDEEHLYSIAYEYIEDAYYSEAVELLKKIPDYKDTKELIAKYSDNNSIYAIHAEAIRLMEMGDFSEAITYLEKLKETDIEVSDLLEKCKYAQQFEGDWRAQSYKSGNGEWISQDWLKNYYGFRICLNRNGQYEVFEDKHYSAKLDKENGIIEWTNGSDYKLKFNLLSGEQTGNVMGELKFIRKE